MPLKGGVSSLSASAKRYMLMMVGLVTQYKKERKDYGENLMVGTCCLRYPYIHGKLWGGYLMAVDCIFSLAK